jgi:phosphoserine phosphatase
MKLYFARHGQTNSNLRKRVVSFNDELTDLGIKQAQELARRIFDIHIDMIFTSSCPRAKETARIIAEKNNLNVQEIDLLGEKKWPSAIEGKLLEDHEVEKFFDLQRSKNNSEPNWHYNNEENFIDVKKRAGLFLDWISKSNYEDILVVSHEYFIKMVISVMMNGDQLTYDIFRNFLNSTALDNTSLTICKKNGNSWKLISMNEI